MKQIVWTSIAFVAATALVLGSVALGRARGESVPAGTLVNEPGVYAGYTLFAPNTSTKTYLIDMAGCLVQSWESDYEPGHSAYLLENGHLLRTAMIGQRNTVFRAGGSGGRVEEYTWDGQLVWHFEYASDAHLLHHDIERLPNGNILMIAWERKTAAQAIAAGRDPGTQADGDLWCDHLIEVRPTRPAGGEIVWEWHAWDHLVQNLDPAKPNYGDPREHPGRLDLNWGDWVAKLGGEQREELEALGYLGEAQKPRGPHGGADWTHTNAVAYNATLDQIVLSVLGFSEIWIIDHGLTTEEAAGPQGDLLYRWGNPQTYSMGGPADRRLFSQHDAHWIPAGCPGAGNILVFNNGQGRRDGRYSSVDEIVPPLGAAGRYVRAADKPFGPEEPCWTYAGRPDQRFFSPNISGAQRLPNGNTLICSGAEGKFLEVTPEGREAWTYVSPVASRRPPPPHGGPPGGGPRMGPPQGRPPGGPPGGGHPPGKDGPRRDVFRAYRYGPSYPGLNGKDLTPGEPIKAEGGWGLGPIRPPWGSRRGAGGGPPPRGRAPGR